MSKFLMMSEHGDVNVAALKLFPNKPNEQEAERLLERRSELTLSTLLAWHAIGDECAPRAEVLDHLRRDDGYAWIQTSRCASEIPADRLRDWYVAAGATAPYRVWLEGAARLASPIGRKIAVAIEVRGVEDVPPPPFDPAFMRILIERHNDGELVAVLVEWLRAQQDQLRCSYLCLLERAGVLDAIPGAVALLPKDVVPTWPPKLAETPLAAPPIANVAHRLALRMPEPHRAAADAWVLEQYLNAIRGGASWLDVFWRVPPRLRPTLAMASLDLDRAQWAPFAGRALAERIANGDHELWPRAMQWLESVWSFRREACRSDYKWEWVSRDLEVRDLLGMFTPKDTRTWEALPPRVQLQLGPLFAAGAADDVEGNTAFHPVNVGIQALEAAPLPPDPAIDSAWAALYKQFDLGLGLLSKRFGDRLVRHRAELLLQEAIRTDLRRFEDRLAAIIALTGYVPLERAPDGERLLRCEIDELRLWRAAAGPAFDERIDERLGQQIATDASATTLHHARLLGRPLRDVWKRAWRAALRTWRFSDVLSFRRDEPWLVNDDELVGLLLVRLGEEGESVFRNRDLPDVVCPVVADHVTTVDDDHLASELLEWLARFDPKDTDARALRRLRERPGRWCSGWWGKRLSSTNQWNERGVDVFDALLSARQFDLACHVVDCSVEARRTRCAPKDGATKNGRPQKQPKESSFMAAIHLALARAICRTIERAVDEDRGPDIRPMTQAMCGLEPPATIIRDIEPVLRRLRPIGIAAPSVRALEELREITRGEGRPEADYPDVVFALQMLAGNMERSR